MKILSFGGLRGRLTMSHNHPKNPSLDESVEITNDGLIGYYSRNVAAIVIRILRRRSDGKNLSR